MKKILLSILLLGLCSCKPEEGPSDVAARAAGRFDVQSYVVNGDTLYTNKGIDKIGVSEFYIVVDRKRPDSVRVGSIYKRIGEPGVVVYTKDVAVSELNGRFQLSGPTSTRSFYEGSITGNAFYERTVGAGIIVVPPSYSLKTPVNPAQEGIIITAGK